MTTTLMTMMKPVLSSGNSLSVENFLSHNVESSSTESFANLDWLATEDPEFMFVWESIVQDYCNDTDSLNSQSVISDVDCRSHDTASEMDSCEIEIAADYIKESQDTALEMDSCEIEISADYIEESQDTVSKMDSCEIEISADYIKESQDTASEMDSCEIEISADYIEETREKCHSFHMCDLVESKKQKRRDAIARWIDKRTRRTFKKKVVCKARGDVAKVRTRVGGRFVKSASTGWVPITSLP